MKLPKARPILALLLAAAVFLTACQPTVEPPPPAAPSATPGPLNTAAPVEPTATPLAPTEPPTATPQPATPTLPPATDTAAPPSPSPAVSASAPAAETPAGQPTPAAGASGQAIIIDHTSVALFDQIPAEYLERARNLRVIYYNASVGQNLSQGLDCLAAASWAEAPIHCRRDYTGADGSWKGFNASDLSAGSVPARIQFPADAVQYDRSRWVFGRYPGDWQPVTADFITTLVPENAAQFDVLSYKITYLMVDERSDISDPNTGFFADQPDRYDVKDLEALFAQYPDKVFFLWTSSLSRNIGTQVALDFNNQMRRYAAENGRILFDIADIEAHTDQGEPCYDNRDGVEFCSNNGECENFADDGQQIPAICQDYTTEIEGGHLGSVSAGKIQLAKAFWVLMARIAGWEP